jgi:hypothetical protein
MTIRPLLPDDLLMLVYRLTGWESGQGRPRTIELRRAVSTAYYALFGPPFRGLPSPTEH